MTLDNLLSRLDAVRSQRRGWVARCPSHEDRNPSLTIAEGDKGILLRCWAGCSVEEIAGALAISVASLFFDDQGTNPQRVRRPTGRERYRPITWREYAGALEDEAFGLWFRAEAVLMAAKRLNISTWTDEDIEAAMAAIDLARVDLKRADCFQMIAFTVRVSGLKFSEEARHTRAS